MTYADETPRLAGPINEHAFALAQEWKRLTRVATSVALLTAPALLLILFDSEHFGLLGALQLPLLLFINFAIFFGPFLFFAVRQIRGYEPGDASWGVTIDDVRGQAEANEEITRVITL